MTRESVYPLGPDTLELFAKKGTQGGADIPQSGLANGLKVRRVMQITSDFAQRPFAELRILDLGCGEGVYAIEAGLRGAEVLALDARIERMNDGIACAVRHGLRRVRFIQEDVRRLSVEAHGSFDVVYLLGLLYHLDTPDIFAVLQNVHNLCRRLLVIDTLISLTVESKVEWRGYVYEGRRCREHGDNDTESVRRSRVLKSIDNTFSFRFTKASLVRLLSDSGFTSVCECHNPAEPGKAEDRITLAVVKGSPVLLSTYPWVNDKAEGENAATPSPHGGGP